MYKFLKLFTIFILIFGFNLTNASECRKYTQEQENLLHLAYEVGSHYDLGLTLAAIVQKESFVGDYIIRVNSQDGKYGSYGVTHILLETGMDLLGMKSSWEARATLVPRLINDDLFAMRMAIKKLLSVKTGESNIDWRNMVSRYNGGGPAARKYGNTVVGIVKSFKKCDTFFVQEHGLQDNILIIK